MSILRGAARLGLAAAGHSLGRCLRSPAILGSLPKNNYFTSVPSHQKRGIGVLHTRTMASAAEPPQAAAAEHKHTNRLAQEESPYLLQHAHNPVSWEVGFLLPLPLPPSCCPEGGLPADRMCLPGVSSCHLHFPLFAICLLPRQSPTSYPTPTLTSRSATAQVLKPPLPEADSLSAPTPKPAPLPPPPHYNTQQLGGGAFFPPL